MTQQIRLEMMQVELDQKYKKRKRSDKCKFVIGAKLPTFGNRPRKVISDGIEFKKVGVTRNKNPRDKAQLVLGKE